MLHSLKFLFAVIALASSPLVSFALNVENLRVEHLTNPSTVDTQRPHFSWICVAKDSKATNECQTKYEIGVSSSLELLKKGRYDVWTTKEVASSESNMIPYEGQPLKSGADYWWRVRVWDGKGKASAWSAPAHWGMGLQEGDWKARWIAPEKIEGNNAPLLRKSFNLSKKVKQAKVFITGMGYFELYVNGQRIGDDYLVPNFTNYTSRKDLRENVGIAIDDNFSAYRVLYLSYDVTPYLQKGDNAIGSILGNGFYKCMCHWVRTFGEPCLLCQMEITYKDGTKEVIATDETWKTHPSAIVMNGVYDGEIYDARKENPHWAEAGCNESDWTNAKLVKGPEGKLSAQTSPSDKLIESLAPVTFQKQNDGSYEVDFGKEISGWIRFSGIEGKAGDQLSVKYISESPLGQQTYIYKGTGKENYAPRFTWYVFRKAVISGAASLTADQLKAEVINTDVPVTADFRTSNPLINKICEIWQRSQMDNMHGCVASDCPHRERSPYTGDGQAACAMVLHNFDAAAFYMKWLRDMRDVQNPVSGYVPNSAPWQPGCGGGVAWGAAMSLMPWEYYVQYGDRPTLEDNFQAMVAETRYLSTWLTADNTMFHQKTNYNTATPCNWLNLGDWCPPGAGPKDELVHTFFLWLCADYTMRAARTLGQNDIAAEMTQLAEKVRNGFIQKFYNAEKKSYGEAGSNIYALRMGIPEEQVSGVVETLRNEIMVTNKGHLNTGFLATKFLFEILAKYGLNDVAYTIINKRDFPSYGWWIEQGATTTWEQWDGKNSHNHPMFGGGLTWFYRCLAGVNTCEEKPGYKHIVFKPVLAEGLDSVYYANETAYGKVASQVINKPGNRSITVTVPVSCTADVCLPNGQTQHVQQGTYMFKF